MDEHYNRHYVATDDRGRVVDGWSGGAFPDKDTTGAVCITQRGGYQFRLTPDGEENPALFDRHGVPLYKLADGQAEARSETELAADRSALPAPGPSQSERLEAQVAYTAMMTDTLMSWAHEGALSL